MEINVVLGETGARLLYFPITDNSFFALRFLIENGADPCLILLDNEISSLSGKNAHQLVEYIRSIDESNVSDDIVDLISKYECPSV